MCVCVCVCVCVCINKDCCSNERKVNILKWIDQQMTLDLVFSFVFPFFFISLYLCYTYLGHLSHRQTGDV